MRGKHFHFFLFLIGLFAEYRVHLIGMIGISEIVIVLMAPIFFIQDFPRMKKEGFMTLFNLLLLTCVSCCISSWVNHTPFPNFIRGFAAPVVLLATFVFMYHFLSRDISGLKWLMTGNLLCSAFSTLLGGAMADVLTGDSYMAGVGRMYTILPLVLLPVYACYTKIPAMLSCFLCGSLGLYTIATSASGRSTALIYLAAAFLIFIGQKSVRKMMKIKKNFVLFMCLSLVMVFAAKVAYSHAAVSGILGEESRRKYERQTQGGGSMLKLLMGGRAEAFICIMAGLDNPIWGLGPWAVDYKGYGRRFKEKFGSDEENAARALDDQYRARMGISGRLSFLPFHSHIFGNWVWYGAAGLILWIYVLYFIFKYFQKYVDVVPQWYGLMALMLPKLTWNIFFSPLYARVETATVLCCLLIMRAVFNRKITFDADSWKERQKFLP